MTASSALDALAGAGLVETVPGFPTRVRLTSTGREHYGPIRAVVDETVTRLYDGLPPDEPAAAGRVLAALTARADAALAQRTPRGA